MVVTRGGDEVATKTQDPYVRHNIREYWHPVAQVGDIGLKPVKLRLLGEDLVAFSQSGEVSVFADLCIHRGAALSLGDIAQDGSLVCAYHGWRYDGRSGACVGIPSLPEGSSIPRKARALKYDAVERYGFVWVRLEAEGDDEPPTWPGGEYDDPHFRAFVAGSYTWETSAGRAAENFMDFSHFAFVHPGLLGTLDSTVVDEHNVCFTRSGLKYGYVGSEPSGYYDGGARGEVTPVQRDYEVVLPFTVHSRKRDVAGKITTISLFVCPTDAKRCRLWVVVLRNHSVESETEFASWNRQFVDFNDEVMEQDRLVVESQRPEQIPSDLREEFHLKVPDAAGLAYRRLLACVALPEGW